MTFQPIHSVDALLAQGPVEFVQSCYRMFLGREADESGLGYYLSCLQAGDSRLSVAANIASSDEAMAQPQGRKVFAAGLLARRVEELLPNGKMSPQARDTALAAIQRYFAVIAGRPLDETVEESDPFQTYFTSVIEDRSR